MITMDIVIDSRENDLIKTLRHLKFDFTVACLDVGDIVVRKGHEVVYCLERKSMADWEASIIDGRYSEQKFRLLNAPYRTGYILEGTEKDQRKRKRISESAFRGSLLNTSVRDGLCVIRTKSLDDTAKLVMELERRLKKSKIKTGLQVPKFKASKRARMTDSQTVLTRMLMCIPSVSENIAAHLINLFKTKIAIQKAAEDEETLSNIKINKRKLGKKVVQNIKQYL